MVIQHLIALTICRDTVRFKVTHRVRLRGSVLRTFDAKRDGSLVGSYGQMGLHDGAEFPLIVLKGIQRVLANESDLASYQVAELQHGNTFKVLHDFKQPRIAVKIGNKLKLGARTSYNWARRQALIQVPAVQTPCSSVFDRLFPVPAGMRDTTSNESVDTYKYLGGTKLCQINTSWHMEYGHRSALTDAGGKTLPMEKCIPGLAGFRVMGIQFVSPEGWFVVDAVREQPPDDSGVSVGFGSELFWIEAVRISK